MTISKPVSQLLHTALLGLATGILSYISSLVVGAPLPTPRAFILALLVAGFSRMAGALLAKIQTPSP